jgi:hypothetical protein
MAALASHATTSFALSRPVLQGARASSNVAAAISPIGFRKASSFVSPADLAGVSTLKGQQTKLQHSTARRMSMAPEGESS